LVYNGKDSKKEKAYPMSRNKMAALSFSYDPEDEGKQRSWYDEDNSNQQLPFWGFGEELHASGHDGKVPGSIQKNDGGEGEHVGVDC
jgi:hypothetical protein